MNPWILAARPKTLTATIGPIIYASSISYYYAYSDINNLTILLAFLSTAFIQIGTNLINDAADFSKGTDNEERLGPLRVCQAGLLNPKKVFKGAVICFILASIFGTPLIIQGGLLYLFLGAFSLLFACAYTMGPFPLAYHGLGEVFVMLFFGLVAVGGLTHLLSDNYSLSAVVLASFQVGSLSCALISINNYRDIEGDRKSNKKTLAVRFGPQFMKFLISFFLLAPLVVGFFWINQGIPLAFYLPLIFAPLGIWISSLIIRTPPSRKFNRFLGLTSLYLLINSLCFAMAMRMSL